MVYPVNQPPIPFGVLNLHDNGTIGDVLTSEEAIRKNINDIVLYDGILVPGLINTHCHLELSHWKGVIQKHSGLVDFVSSIIAAPETNEHIRLEAMLAADAEMLANGIVAVGDISNREHSHKIKKASELYYHTFCEALGLNSAHAQAFFEACKINAARFQKGQTSITPHAPYSVSRELFDLIEAHAQETGNILSIHNQESEEENIYFRDKSGGFTDLYEKIGAKDPLKDNHGKSSLKTILPWISPFQKTLLVHNTFTSADDVAFAASRHPDLYWCLCPNANLYIENCLPDVEMLRDAGLRITLGTDSLASNDQLSIIEEMKTLQQHKNIAFDDLIRWATLNGAEFLGIDDRYGSFEKGKKPGVNLIEHANEGQMTDNTTIRRLF